MKAELNKTYNFDYTGSVSPFGLLDLEETYEVFRDGRVSCHFLERDIAKIFQEKSHAHAKDLIYICCDIVEFPRVRMIFKTGSGLTQEYPLCHISQSKREVLFG